MSNEIFTLHVNGEAHQVRDSWLGENLMDVLRDRLGLMGSKGACEQGECGSCSVLVDGDLVCSCLVMAASAVGQQVVTIEELRRSAAPVMCSRRSSSLEQCNADSAHRA